MEDAFPTGWGLWSSWGVFCESGLATHSEERGRITTTADCTYQGLHHFLLWTAKPPVYGIVERRVGEGVEQERVDAPGLVSVEKPRSVTHAGWSDIPVQSEAGFFLNATKK